MKYLSDHIVAVTGAGSGLGRGVVQHFIEEGAQLSILEVVPEKVASLRDQYGDAVLVVEGDASKLADVLAFRDATVERYGRVTSLVSIHGIFDSNVPLKQVPMDKVGDLFDELFSVNVKGNFLLARAFIEQIEAEKGAMVFTASTAAFAADGGGLAYTASKGAVRSLVSQLAFEFSPHVRVNGVAPAVLAKSQLRGPAALGLENSKQSDIPREAFEAGFKTHGLIQRLPEPEEYGPIYAFLASRHNTIMTGQTHIADQGILNRALISAHH